MLQFTMLLLFIILSGGLAWYFIAHDHGEKEPIGALWFAAGFGLIAAIGAGIIEAYIVPAHDITSGKPLLVLLGSCLLVGCIEEVCKFVPLSLYIFKKRYFNEHTDGIIYFALTGLGFGLPENILYTLQFGTKAALGRIILTPFFHAATTGVVGSYLARAKISGLARWKVCAALLTAIVLHGIYDFGLISGNGYYTVLSIVITLCLSAGLFLVYIKATDMDQERGLSAVGHNMFCRACGFPNPHRHLYCTHCGQYA